MALHRGVQLIALVGSLPRYQMKLPPPENKEGMSEGNPNLRCHRAAPELFQHYLGCDTTSPSN